MSDQMQPVREKISVGCTVFGNRITPKLAYEEVSREHIVLRSDTKIADPRVHLLKALEDCKESGWRLCAPQ